jgi:Raf kinase inhibitor-like YbhB/YbcL family protein
MSKLTRTLSLVIILGITLGACAPNPEPTENTGPVQMEEAAQADTAEDEASEESGSSAEEEESPMKMALTSPAFNNGDPIPERFTCDGEDISPELDWFGLPDDTVSLALIMDDPDAPGGTWVHWVLYNLPMDLTGLREGMDDVGQDGANSWNSTGYGGPCPPSGTHRYFFKLYALDVTLDLEPGADKAALLDAIEGHVVGQAELMGTYSR